MSDKPKAAPDAGGFTNKHVEKLESAAMDMPSKTHRYNIRQAAEYIAERGKV